VGNADLNNLEIPFLCAVVHCATEEQTIRNVERAKKCGVNGVFLINHGFPYQLLMQYAAAVLLRFPDYWIGLNLLGVDSHKVFSVIPPAILQKIKGIWVDDAGIDERVSYDQQYYAIKVKNAIKKSGYQGLYFGGVAFKYRREVTDLESAAISAINWMDVVTTSGPGTGKAADIEKIKRIKLAMKNHPLGIASGVTAQNVGTYLEYADFILVATGISDSFTELSESKTKELVGIIDEFKKSRTSKEAQ